MKNKIQNLLIASAMLLTFNLQPLTAHAQGTAFSYQGRLNDGTNAATGIYDLRFTIYDAVTGGTAHGALTNAATGITNGLFAVTLDFGGVFNGANYWLELAARTNGGGAFSTLSPRQPVLPMPYAIYAGNAGNAATATTATTANSASSVAAANITGIVQLGQLPAAVVTNHESGMTLNGTFNGNGAGLTNLNLTGPSAYSALGNTANGYQSLNQNTSGTNNVANGFQSLYSNTTGYNNAANGAEALFANTTGIENTADGWNALNHNTTGVQNPANGSEALANNTTGNYNAANGVAALQSNTSGSYNTANGFFALQKNTTGQLNAANGGWSLYANTTGSYNTANGEDALHNNTTGNQNTADGGLALNNNTSGSTNVDLGFQAGYNITTGSYNIDIGNMGLATDTNLIRIGSGQTQAIIAGIITGNGGGLTNLNASQLASGTVPLAQLPGVVVTNNQSGLTLSGTFIGDGSQLGNLSAYQLSSGTIPDSLLSPDVALLGASQTFQGQNVFNSNVGIGNANPTNKLMVVNARCDGSSWINASDRNLKQGFASVDAQAVLARVIAMPVQTWSYKAQPEQKHLGPVAQDFHAAFGLGADDVSIATVDESGVALAAIQGLNQKLNAKDAEIEALKQSVAELKQLVQTLAEKK